MTLSPEVSERFAQKAADLIGLTTKTSLPALPLLVVDEHPLTPSASNVLSGLLESSLSYGALRALPPAEVLDRIQRACVRYDPVLATPAFAPLREECIRWIEKARSLQDTSLVFLRVTGEDAALERISRDPLFQDVILERVPREVLLLEDLSASERIYLLPRYIAEDKAGEYSAAAPALKVVLEDAHAERLGFTDSQLETVISLWDITSEALSTVAEAFLASTLV